MTTPAPETPDTAQDGQEPPQEPTDVQQPPQDPQDPPEAPEDPDTFPRSYVEGLRTEAAEARTRAADRDALAERLHGSLVAATGRLEDPTDLPFDEAHLTDPESLSAALDDLLTAKPHLRARRVGGDVGQGQGDGADRVSLADLLRARA